MGELTEVQRKKLLDIKNDFYRFCDNNLYIRSKAGEIIKFVPNLPQRILIDFTLMCIQKKLPIRAIVLKARQLGLSTAIEALGYWWASTNKHQTSVIIGHEEDSAKNLYAMFRRYYDNSNPLFKPTVKYKTRSDLTFEKYDEFGNQVGLGSIIKTASARNTSTGRSDTVQFLHCCMHPDSPIILANGKTVTARDIQIGDEVFTSSGAIAPVKNKFYTGEKPTNAIRVWGSNEPVYLTGEHKVLTIDGYKKAKSLTTRDWVAKPKYTYEESHEYEFQYQTNKRLQGGGISIDDKRAIKLDYDFGYLVGYYLAEGHIKKGLNQITFTYHKDETFINKIKPFFGSFTDEVVGNRGRTHFYDTFMAHLLNDICGRVESKQLKLIGNEKYLFGVFDGYMDGDGSKTRRDAVVATSIHELIARNVNRVGDILGWHGGLSTRGAGEYYGRNCKKTYTNSFNTGEFKPHIRKYKWVDGVLYVRVKSIEEYETAETIDIEIDHPDHNFETPVGIISNSEVGEWSDGEELVASLLQTVPNLPNTFIFLESTAKGRDTYFYREWRAAERGENNFTPFFFAWWLIDEYEIWDKKPLGKLNDYEKFLVDLFKKGYSTPTGEHLTVPEEKFAAKIKFYRRKQKDFASDPVKMFQEYPSVAQEAFLASGGTVFPVMKLQQMEVECIDETETEYFDLIPADQHEQFVLSPVEYDTRVDDFTAVAPLKVFEHPNVGSEYVIGADVAEGLKRGDYSVAEVVDTNTMKTVARWRGHIDPDRFGEILGALGAMYNYALIGVEINNHGLTTVQKLRDSFYTNLYKRERGYDLDFEEPTSNLGWKTDMRTKRLAINDLVHIVREGLNEDKDIVFINEAFSFVRDDRGRMGAESGEHDDVIMAKAIAFQLFGWGDTNIKGLKVYKKTKKHEVIK